MTRAYSEYLANAFKDETAWKLHQGELLEIVGYAGGRNVRLVVVVSPNLVDVPGTREYTEKVVALFRGCGVTVVDIGEVVSGQSAAPPVVNRLDAHPNTDLHRQIGCLLYDVLAEN
jgi:hypothetical protein